MDNTQSLKPFLSVDTFPKVSGLERYPVRIKSYFCDDEGLISGTVDNSGPVEHEVIWFDSQDAADLAALSLRKFVDKVNALVQPNSKTVSPNCLHDLGDDQC